LLEASGLFLHTPYSKKCFHNTTMKEFFVRQPKLCSLKIQTLLKNPPAFIDTIPTFSSTKTHVDTFIQCKSQPLSLTPSIGTISHQLIQHSFGLRLKAAACVRMDTKVCLFFFSPRFPQDRTKNPPCSHRYNIRGWNDTFRLQFVSYWDIALISSQYCKQVRVKKVMNKK